MSNNRNERNNHFNCNSSDETHNHEFLTSTNYDEDDDCEVHNHRVAGVTGPAIPCRGGSHIHKVETFVDTYDGHIHKICDVTGPALKLRNGKHIHLVKGETSKNDENNHDHAYFFTTLIDNPSDIDEDKCDR